MDQPHDGQLLADVAANSSQRSFEELVRQHGGMVYHECRRLLAHAQDAEDAAQAVFLVLWKKAVSLRAKPTVADWLHRVARNICRNAQRARTVRQLHERRAAEQKAGLSEPGGSRNEILDVLDEHLDRLPEKYRLPLILFHLEGRSVEEIAALLSTNVSTITTRLNRGREALRTRIARRGMVVSSGMLMAALGSEAGAALPETFAIQAAESASLFATGQILPTTFLSTQSIALAKGALHMLAITKFKVTIATVAAVLLLGGTSIVMVNTVLHADAPQAQTVLATNRDSSKNDNPDGITLKSIIATLEKQREQVKSLTIETKTYNETLVDPEVMRFWKQFRRSKVTNPELEFRNFQEVDVFAYKGGQRFLRMLQTAEYPLDEHKEEYSRKVVYNSERASDGKRVWERRVNLKQGPAQVFVLPVKPGEPWTQNPGYCRTIGWDCRTELHTQDEEALKLYRKSDFLSMLKEGAYTLDAGTTLLDGAKCVLLWRKREAELSEYDLKKDEVVTVKSPATETIWLDVDRGFVILQREWQTERWGLNRTTNSEFVEILTGLWFPQKTKGLTFAPPDAPQEYQGRPVASGNTDLLRWSVNDVPDSRFDMITKPGDLLAEKGKPLRVIGDDGQPIDQTKGNSKPSSSKTDDKTNSTGAAKALTAEQEQFVALLEKAGSAAKPETAKLRVAIATGERCNPPGIFVGLLDVQVGCRCEEVPLADMEKGVLKSYDVLLIPGGHAETQAEQLGESGRRAIREFVEAGGGYVGVCAGAKLATTNFDWSLKLINARTLSETRESPSPDGVISVDMGKRGSGDVQMELTDAGRKILAGPEGLIETAFRMSPVLLPTNQTDLPRCIPLSDYRSEVWLHSLHIGTMVNTPSILAGQYGKGRVIVFSSHPEGRDETEPMLVRAVLAAGIKPANPD